MKHPKRDHHAVDSPQTLHHWCDACYALTMNNQLNTDIVRDVSYHSANSYWFLTMQQNTEKLIDTTSMISNLRSVSSVTTSLGQNIGQHVAAGVGRTSKLFLLFTFASYSAGFSFRWWNTFVVFCCYRLQTPFVLYLTFFNPNYFLTAEVDPHFGSNIIYRMCLHRKPYTRKLLLVTPARRRFTI